MNSVGRAPGVRAQHKSDKCARNHTGWADRYQFTFRRIPNMIYKTICINKILTSQYFLQRKLPTDMSRVDANSPVRSPCASSGKLWFYCRGKQLFSNTAPQAPPGGTARRTAPLMVGTSPWGPWHLLRALQRAWNPESGGDSWLSCQGPYRSAYPEEVSNLRERA